MIINYLRLNLIFKLRFLKISFFIFSAALIVVFSFSKCAYENEAKLFDNCDTLNMTYLKDIKPILAQNCYMCHASSIKSGGFDMEDFNELSKRLDSKLLINAINRKVGYPQMPKLRDKLPECTIRKITAWNNAGHLKN